LKHLFVECDLLTKVEKICPLEHLLDVTTMTNDLEHVLSMGLGNADLLNLVSKNGVDVIVPVSYGAVHRVRSLYKTTSDPKDVDTLWLWIEVCSQLSELLVLFWYACLEMETLSLT
jgi:hypothetical protein